MTLWFAALATIGLILIGVGMKKERGYYTVVDIGCLLFALGALLMLLTLLVKLAGGHS